MWITISRLSYTAQSQDIFQKKVQKSLWAIDELTLKDRGFVLLAGRNGSGKSTLLRCLLGLIHPTQGTFFWGHGEVVGYVPEFPIIPPQLALGAWLRAVCGALPGGGPLAGRAPFDPLVALGEQLVPLLKVPAHRLSKGQQQKAHLWVALCRSPTTLVLDEPFSGLDPWARAELANFLCHWAAMGGGILMAGHEMPQGLEPHCSQTWLLEDHRLHIRQGCALPTALSPSHRGPSHGPHPQP